MGWKRKKEKIINNVKLRYQCTVLCCLMFSFVIDKTMSYFDTCPLAHMVPCIECSLDHIIVWKVNFRIYEMHFCCLYIHLNSILNFRLSKNGLKWCLCVSGWVIWIHQTGNHDIQFIKQNCTLSPSHTQKNIYLSSMYNTQCWIYMSTRKFIIILFKAELFSSQNPSL